MKQEEMQKKIAELQLLEQSIQNFAFQKQTFQQQALEVDNALEELKKTKGTTYKIVGNIMIASNKDDLNKDLESKKELLDVRLKNIEKQENTIKDKTKKLQEEVMSSLKKR